MRTVKLDQSTAINAKGPLKDKEVPALQVRVQGDKRTFIIRSRVNGKQILHTIGDVWAISAEEARDRAREAIKLCKAGINPNEQAKAIAADTLGKLLDDYIARKEEDWSESYLRDAKRYRNGLPASLTAKPLAELKAAHIEDGLNHLRSKKAAFNQAFALVRGALNWAVKREMIHRNPAGAVDQFQLQGRDVYLTKAQVAAVIDAMDHQKDRTVIDILSFIIWTGCRGGEARAARWDQFDLEEGIWHKQATDTKQNKVHRVRLSPQALSVLERRREACDGKGYVFPSRTGEPITYKRYSRVWHDIREAAGLGDVRPHDLRHTFASFAAAAGLDMRTVGALLGHSSTKTTDRYVHLFDENLKGAAEKVGEALSVGKS